MVLKKTRLSDGQRDHFKQEWILREQLRLLSRPSWFGALSGLILAALLVFLFSDLVATKIRVPWFAFFCAASMVRLLANRLLISNEDASLNELEKKLNYYCFSLAGVGACWAATPFIFCVSGDWRSQSYMIIIQLGIAAGALSSLAFVKKTFLSFAPLVVLPLILRFLIEGGKVQTLFGLAGIPYFILIVVTARMIAELIESSLKNTIENKFLMEETQLTNKRLKERTEQLKKAKEHAESASRIKGEFLTNVSHEIRTPLNAVLGFLELVLESTSLSANQRKQLTTAQVSAKGLLRLINDILDLNKLENGKLTIEQRPFDLGQLMREIHEAMDMRARKKGLDFQIDIGPSLSKYYMGDPLRLKQIMVNLVDNAIKFTEKGGICIKVLATEEKDQLHFVSADTGIGMRADQLDEIFDPFAQADTSMTRRSGGTGLGTTISKELVALMGGRIWAESEEGKGSTFHFIIRMLPTDQPPKENDFSMVPGRPIMPGYRRGFRILLAEDVEAIADLAKIRLKRQGHEVAIARNGREAVEAFVPGEIDVILMDVQMPEMDGIEAAKRIRVLEANTGGHVPIIAMTGGVIREEREEFPRTGMDAVVAKPIDFGELFDTMETVVPQGVGKSVPEKAMEVETAPGLALSKLDGVDTQKGLDRWQNPEAYAKALLGFSRDYANAADDVTRFVDNDDMESALLLAHNIKGVSGNLSITSVFDAAAKINSALKEERIDDVKDQIPTLVTALNRAVDSIGTLKASEDVQELPGKKADRTKLRELFTKMLAAFDEFSPYAIEPFLAELKRCLQQDQLTPIVVRMERFDFDGAIQETIKLAKLLEIDLDGEDEKRIV